MRFNLSSLKKRQFDFVIQVHDAPLNDIWVRACKEELLFILDDLLNELKAEGFLCYSHKDYWKSIAIFAKGVNAQEVGERIAIELERAGYSVQRLVPAPLGADHDRSAKVEIQSFLLA